MPSIWCPKCQTNKHRESKCPKCGYIEGDNSKSYKVPKSKPVKLVSINKNDSNKYINNFPDMSKNPLLIGAVLIIAISVGYLAFAKYQENRKYDKWMEVAVGTSDPDKAMEIWQKQIKQAEKNLDKVMLENTKRQKELFDKMIVDNTKN